MIYLYTDKIPIGEKVESLPYIEKVVSAHCGFPVVAKKDESGKPMVNVPGIFVSATHTERTIICAVAEEKIGIDGEIHRFREIQYEKIAARFFTLREQRYVREDGLKGFYEIWVRKEAYMKYTGIGMSYGFNNIETMEERGFLPEIDGCRIFFQKKEELYFACAGGQGELQWIDQKRK